MTDILSRVQILMDADTARFEQKMNAAPTTANKAFDKISASATKMSNIVKGAVAGISAASVASFALDVVNAGNEVKKFADLTGSSTSQFQYYSKGAQVAGYTLEQFAMLNKDVFDRLGEASRGEGEMMDFFEKIAPKIGVTIDQFKNLSGPEVLQKYYDGLEKANLSQPEMVTYMEQIADDASLLIPMLKNGGAGFEFWGEKAKEAGSIMSEDMIDSLIDAKQNLQVLDLQWQGFQATLVNGAMPVLSTVVQNFDMVIAGAGVLSAIVGSRVVTGFVHSTVATMANTAATKNKVIVDYELAKAELASTAAMVKSMGAINAETAALVANARVKYQAAAAAREAAVASTTMATVGRGALALVGGWAGLGLTVASVAAGYLLLRDNGGAANSMLEHQSRYASMATDELGKLSGAQRRAAEKELSSELIIQSGHLQKAKNDFEALTEKVLDSNKGNQEAYRIWAELRTGVIDVNQAYLKLNQANFVTPEQINSLTDSKTKVTEYDGVIKKLNIELGSIKANGTNAAWGIDAVGDAAGRATNRLAALNSEQIKYVKQVESNALKERYIQNQIALGYSRERATHMADSRSTAGMGFSAKDGAMPEALRQAEAQAWALEQAEKAREVANKKAEEAAKKHQAAIEKANSDAEKLREKQFQARESIYYEYASREMKIEKDLQNQLKVIREAGFSDPKMQAGYIANAQNKANLEKRLYTAQLAAELNEWQDNEQEKLNRQVKINELRINLDSDMNDDQKQQALDSLIDRSNQELAWMKLEERQRISDAGAMLRTDLQNMEIKYGFERDQILLNSKLSEDEQKRRVALSYASEEFEKRQNLNDATAAWGGTFADLTGTGDQYRLEQERFSRSKESDFLFDSKMALANTAAEREAIWQAHNDRMYLIDKKYQEDKLNLGLNSAQAELGTMTSVWGQILGEQSATYAAMASASKAFAVFQALMNVPTTFSNVYASISKIPMVGPYLAPVMATDAAATQVAQAAMIKGYNLTGQAHDGIDKVPETGTWLLKKGERVTTESTSKKLDKKLDEVGAAERQIRETKQADPSVQFNPDIAIFDSRETAERWMMGKGGEKAVLYHLKRNKSNLGI